jgi:hypothetical protein
VTDKDGRKIGKVRLYWPGDIKHPGWSAGDRPGPLDVLRKQFLDVAVEYVPTIKTELEAAGNDARKLKSWQKKWRLTAPWCVRILREGVRQPIPPEEIEAVAEGFRYQEFADKLKVFEPETFDLDYPPPRRRDGGWARPGGFGDPVPRYWNTGPGPRVLELRLDERFFFDVKLESLNQFKRRVLDYIEGVIKEFEPRCVAVIAEAQRTGFKPVPEKHVIDDSDPGRHFDWLVRYQIEGESYRKIASTDNLSDGHRTVDLRAKPENAWHTVKAGIWATPKQIGLPRRPNQHSGK